MTGIERLRELAGGTIDASVWMCVDDEYSGSHGLSYADEGGPIGGLLSDITDQIERELREERDRWDDELANAIERAEAIRDELTGASS